MEHSIIEVDASHKITVSEDHGDTFYCALRRYNPETKRYDVISDCRAMTEAEIPRMVEMLRRTNVY